MKISILEQNGTTFEYLIEREKGHYNNIVERITLESVDGLSADEIKTLGFIKLKPIAIRVFEAIEPLDEIDNPVGFEIIPSRVVSINVVAPSEVVKGSEAFVTKHTTDQYDQITSEEIQIDSSAVGEVIIEGKTIKIIDPIVTPTLEERLAQAESDNLTTLEALAEVYELLLALQS